MNANRNKISRFVTMRLALLLLLMLATSALADGPASSSPSPLLKEGQPVQWWFVFKFNTKTFPECGGSIERKCIFGGEAPAYEPGYSQQFVYASKDAPTLQQGSGACVGDTTADPVGATFNELYNGSLHYVLWNDQFYGNPIISKGAPAGHSKGALAWDDQGNGFVLQVSTPSWPGSGSAKFPRPNDGNTLGCVKDNDVLVSQHFFALALTKSDVMAVLKALQNASVVTDVSKPELVNNGGPDDIQALVKLLGKNSKNKTATKETLSSGVVLISKPSDLHVPPWQMVSALLGGVSLRVASWWAKPEIPSTKASTPVKCWDASLGKRGAVQIATSGKWGTTVLGLDGVDDPDGNHAKIGVSTSGTHRYSIFGDMNQQGSLSGPKCESSQNGRGGLFFVVEDKDLAGSITSLIKGSSGRLATTSP